MAGVELAAFVHHISTTAKTLRSLPGPIARLHCFNSSPDPTPWCGPGFGAFRLRGLGALQTEPSRAGPMLVDRQGQLPAPTGASIFAQCEVGHTNTLDHRW